MDRLIEGVRITFEGVTCAEANRLVQALREDLIERVGSDLVASIDKENPDSQDGGSTLVLLFGSSAAVAIAQGIRAYLTRRGDDRDRITIKTSDGTEILATGEAARTLDAAALVRAGSGGRIWLADARARPAPTRILFLAANPSGTSELSLDHECSAVELELRLTAHGEDFDFRSKWAVSVDELGRHLMQFQPAIIHFSGHGACGTSAPLPPRSSVTSRDVAASGNGEVCGIVLHNESHGSQLVSARGLAMMIKSVGSSVRLVVLNACYSDTQAEALRTTVDCVIGMTGPISDTAARSFAVAFYRALGHQRSVGHAVEHAVATLAAKQFPDEQVLRCWTRDGLDANQIVFHGST
ncbi:MAG: CHAT domain-containing protein [Kofleriaceae bacterium]